MNSISLLDYTLRSSQGDLYDTLQVMKSGDVNIGIKRVETLAEVVEIPYYILDESISEDVDKIKELIKDEVKKLTDKLSKEQKGATALLVGTSLVDQNIVDAVESSLYEYKKEKYQSVKKSIDFFASQIAQELSLHPFTMTVSTACTSSVNALLEAKNLINSGVVEYAIVVGVEIFSQMMSNGFSSMKLLSSDLQRPFDTQRDGLILGEAVAAVLVGKEESLWSLKGGYSNCNSLNITSVSPTGEEYAEVMREAMRLSNITREDITALKTHATSTPTNDMSEIHAIEQVFEPSVVFTALKPYVGHTLGACGVLELAILMAVVDSGFIPKTLNHKSSIIEEYRPLQEHLNCHSGTFMLNYFGFGGNNTSIIIKKEAL